MRIWCTEGVIVRLEAFRKLYTKRILFRDRHHVQLTVSCIHLQEIWILGNTLGAWILLIFTAWPWGPLRSCPEGTLGREGEEDPGILALWTATQLETAVGDHQVWGWSETRTAGVPGLEGAKGRDRLLCV